MAVGFAVALILADVGFGIYDTARVSQGRLPERNPGIAQAAIAAPQVVLLGIGAVALSAENAGGEPYMAGLVLLPGAANALFMNGVWSATTKIAVPGVLYGVSAAVGFDTALTASILGRASQGYLSGTGMGIMQMALTAPQIAAGSYIIAGDPRNAGGWGALVGVSGGLFLHGLVSTILSDRAPPPIEPPPPPQPTPSERPPLLVPASIHLAPMPVAGGGGISLGGQWL